MHKRKRYPVDASAILYLAQMEKRHTNVYRFAVTLTEVVCPETLQQAADNCFHRFPTIMAGFDAGLFAYTVVAAEKAPRVQPDSGILDTMSMEEIRKCAYRICYEEKRIAIEVFHALTDGYGAIVSLRMLLAEYLHLRHGICIPEWEEKQAAQENCREEEFLDAYVQYAQGAGARMPNRRAYQIARADRDWCVKVGQAVFPTEKLLAAARSNGVSLTALLCWAMADAIMEIQRRENVKKELPVRIMVPIDLRRQFPSETLRNFILYALPTLDKKAGMMTKREKMQWFQKQLRIQLSRDNLQAQISANVFLQKAWFYRMLPLCVKRGLMRLAYRFFGECNSSITLTNLGQFPMSGELERYISQVDVLLTPRRITPYNCSVISCGNATSISVTRFCHTQELEELFFGRLHSLLQ